MNFSKHCIYVFRVILTINAVSLNVVCRSVCIVVTGSVVCEMGTEFVVYESVITMKVGLQMVNDEIWFYHFAKDKMY